MVTMNDVRAAIDPDEPDYDRAATELGAAAMPFLAELGGSDDAMLASKAISLAGAIGGPEAIPLLERAAAAPHAEVRVVTANAAGELGTDAEDVLAALLSDGDVGVRKRAVMAAARISSARLQDQLTAMSESDSDIAIRRRAKEALG
ncbi:HEAT repeat-containing protein [Nonomuraea solani]|uniref:HEAT repeat-containing protein n=1 Tax=Nonomuraea solani TaxID=1144553 RepID=A0A1H6CJ97_9ACTN|nr:HEAT repeat domain-containing protein [Nonomuraea solani]SEG72992.1 HEAT repeat-containing protein [Nonomuraea solani]